MRYTICRWCGKTWTEGTVHMCPGGTSRDEQTTHWSSPSGAKSSEQKPRYDLIPAVALEREAIRMAEGAEAHGENNYQKGKGDPVFVRDRVNHLIEHALKYAAGDRSTDHLAAVRCNAAMLMWLE